MCVTEASIPIITEPAIIHESDGAHATSRSPIATAAYIRIISERRSSTSPSGTNPSSPTA
jgi:hypothetical protein